MTALESESPPSSLGQEDRESLVRVGEVLPGFSARLGPEDEDHARMLAAIVDELPPILVGRDTMHVVDGHHRLLAAVMAGSKMVRVRYFDGASDDAFVEAVRLNTTHGKPLSLTEREAAARRILSTHGRLSDRAIAEICGMSPRTIGKLRSATEGGPDRGASRKGRDGRIRPVDSRPGRALAARLLAERPTASLREVAREAGISPGTVRSVRDGQRSVDGVGSGRTPRNDSAERGTDSAELRQHGGATPAGYQDLPGVVARGWREGDCDLDYPEHAKLVALRGDASLRATPAGRRVVEWLVNGSVCEDWDWVVEAVPLSRVYAVADIARAFARRWTALADALEDRVHARSR